MAEGIEALRNIAGLQSITPVVPVTFMLESQRSLQQRNNPGDPVVKVVPAAENNV